MDEIITMFMFIIFSSIFTLVGFKVKAFWILAGIAWLAGAFISFFPIHLAFGFLAVGAGALLMILGALEVWK